MNAEAEHEIRMLTKRVAVLEAKVDNVAKYAVNLSDAHQHLAAKVTQPQPAPQEGSTPTCTDAEELARQIHDAFLDGAPVALLTAYAERVRAEERERCARAVESIHHCTDHVLSECPGSNADWIRCTAKRIRSLAPPGSESGEGAGRG